MEYGIGNRGNGENARRDGMGFMSLQPAAIVH